MEEVEYGWNVSREAAPDIQFLTLQHLKEFGQLRATINNNPVMITQVAKGENVALTKCGTRSEDPVVELYADFGGGIGFEPDASAFLLGSGRELLKFEAKGDLASETALLLGELYFREGHWKFRAVGQGYSGGLDSLARGFGVGLEEPGGDGMEVPCTDETEDPEVLMDSQVPKTLVDLSARSSENDLPSAEKTSLAKKKRRSSSDVLAERATEIRMKMKPILCEINSALHQGANESATRLILDKILQEVLGYSISEINPEQNIQGIIGRRITSFLPPV